MGRDSLSLHMALVFAFDFVPAVNHPFISHSLILSPLINAKGPQVHMADKSKQGVIYGLTSSCHLLCLSDGNLSGERKDSGEIL